jgi:hypothetical protein
VRRSRISENRQKTASLLLAFLDWLRMNIEAGDLWEFFLYAAFERPSEFVDLGDGQAILHGAVAGYQDFVLNLPHQERSQRRFALRGTVPLCIIASKPTHQGK